MIQDQYRAIMQYSVSKESLGQDKIQTDWYCAKVSWCEKFDDFFIKREISPFVVWRLQFQAS